MEKDRLKLTIKLKIYKMDANIASGETPPGVESDNSKNAIETSVNELCEKERVLQKDLGKTLDILIDTFKNVEATGSNYIGSCGQCTGCAGSNSHFEESGVRISENLTIVRTNSCYVTPIIAHYEEDEMTYSGWYSMTYRKNGEWKNLEGKTRNVARILQKELPTMLKMIQERTQKTSELIDFLKNFEG